MGDNKDSNRCTLSQHQQGDDDEIDLPEFSISMRAALQRCIDLSESLASMAAGKDYVLHVDARIKQKADTLNTTRKERYFEFWKKLDGLSQKDRGTMMTPILVANEISSHHFREQFHCQNLPCLIQLDVSTPGAETQPFDYVNKNWRSDNRQEINRDWFIENVGALTQVPLRFSTTEASLDSEGRATECETRHVSMSEWVEMSSNRDGAKGPFYYLKDWHLVSLLNENGGKLRQSDPLYTCPDIFQVDLLNPFFSTFTNGDYKFCYWGPEGSKTLRHADVLHSFSWSYNVHGTKRWTFFSNDSHDRQFTVIQKAGQAMFVPCTWQHEVENMEETISINHNWITVANIDKTWECLLSEMKEIENELERWGITEETESYIESCESMLRGCVGLNVTAFFAMTLLRLLEVLVEAASTHTTKRRAGSSIGSRTDGLSFDCYRLLTMVELIMGNKYVQLEQRIKAVTMSTVLAKESLRVALLTSSVVSLE